MKILNEEIYKHGLICGRFQPLHIAHIRLIQKALKECRNLTVAIGSAQDEITERNPYTYLERYMMIKNVFLDDMVNKSKLHIVPILDINNPPEWARHVLDNILISSYSNDPIDMYYAGSEYDAYLFKEAGIPTSILERGLYKSGTEIREMLSKNDLTWKDHTPEVNWSIISEKN